MTVRVTDTLHNLERDLRSMPKREAMGIARAVDKSTAQGHRLAQGFAKKSAGPHGKAYYKRITSEMLSPTTGEYGPNGDVAGNAVGAGWRHGRGNNDLDRSADIVGPKFVKDITDLIDRLFW